MFSKFQTERSHTNQAQHLLGNYVVDMTTLEFQATDNLGPAKLGTLSCRATWVQGHEWATIENMGHDSALLAGGLEADDFLAQFLTEPGMAEAIVEARQEVGRAQAAEPCCGLAALRLRAGLSQKELGERMGKLQPAIARWERDPFQMNMDNVHALCDALQISEQEFHDAIRAPQDTKVNV